MTNAVSPHERIDKVIELDQLWRNALKDMEDGRRERNQAARGIADAKKSGDMDSANKIMAQVKDLGDRIAALDEKANSLLEETRHYSNAHPKSACMMLSQWVMMKVEIPSTHFMDEKPEFSFEPRTHNELIEMNKWVDLERAAKIAGSRFFFLKGDLARLELALQTYAVDFLDWQRVHSRSTSCDDE
jgi:seryl-tRNA synthetase